jgi:hypothetical protein
MTKEEALAFTKEKIFAPLGWEVSVEKKWYEL